MTGEQVRRRPEVEEITLRGLGVAPGIAAGTAYVVEPGIADVPVRRLTTGEVASERARFADAVAKAHRQVEALRAKLDEMPPSAAEEMGYLLDAHARMLEGSRLVRGVDRRIAEQRLNPEAALMEELSSLTQAFAAMEDAYLAARVQDIRDVADRLLRNLLDVGYQAFSDLPEGTVILAEELSPSDTALMDPARIAGFATEAGGVQGHTAIMARSLGLPAVSGIPNLVGRVPPGAPVIVDGDAGRLIVHPSPATLAHYRALKGEHEAAQRHLARLRDVPAVTRDGIRLAMQANLELPGEIAAALEVGAEGVGLLRTEFLYMNRDEPPSEDEQYRDLKDIIEGMGGRPVTARTLDLGSDKLGRGLGADIPRAVNPALGVRAIRLSLRVPELLEAQLAAILRAGAHGPVRILLPMIGSAGEVRRVRAVLDRVVRRLHSQRVRIADPLPPLGVMIEVPGAALSADSLARVCDFFSIGSNDLTMYTLAIDRGDDNVAALYDPLHPAVLRLVQFAVEAAHRASLPVGVCGEIAGDPRFTPLLLGLGVRELSMAPASLPIVKQRVLTLSLDEARRRASTIMEQSDPGVIAALLDDFDALA